MPSVNRNKVVLYTQQQMYELVNDVEAYSSFVPYCVDSHICQATPNEVRATLRFSRGGLSKSFTTVNRLQPHRMIEIHLVDGPFKQLEGFWSFTSQGEHGEACCIALDLEFEFSSHWMAIMFGPFFEQVASMLVDAFSQRADAIYRGVG